VSTETFTAKFLREGESQFGEYVQVEYNGIKAFLSRDKIERMEKVGDRITVTIPYSLYMSKFENGK